MSRISFPGPGPADGDDVSLDDDTLGMLDPDTAVATFNGTADAMGLSAGEKAAGAGLTAFVAANVLVEPSAVPSALGNASAWTAVLLARGQQTAAAVQTSAQDRPTFQEMAVQDALRARAAAVQPTAWVPCGNGYTDFWSTPVTLPSPSSSAQIRSWHRSRTVVYDVNGFDFQEGQSESKDGPVGSWDREEPTATEHRKSTGRARLYFEDTASGDTVETHQVRGCDIPIGLWVEKRVDVDYTAGTRTLRVRVDAAWDYEDPDDGSTWATVAVDEGDPYTLIASDNVALWLGRGGGEFDIARERRWNDGVEVLDANPATGTPGASSFEDSVLEDGGSPAVWTRNAGGTAVITTA